MVFPQDPVPYLFLDALQMQCSFPAPMFRRHRERLDREMACSGASAPQQPTLCTNPLTVLDTVIFLSVEEDVLEYVGQGDHTP